MSEQQAPPTVIGKITAKTVGCEEAKADFVLIGKATHYEKDESEYGSFYRIFGLFEGINNKTDEAFTAFEAIVPGIAEKLIISQIKAEENRQGSAAVSFAVRLFHEECTRKESSLGYIWRMQPLTPVAGMDELTELRRIAMKALPAPE